MASNKKSSVKEVPSVITEAVEGIVEKYDISDVFQKVIEEQATTVIGGKKTSRRAKNKDTIKIATDVLNKSTKSKLEDSPAAAQIQPIQGLNNNKIKLLLQGLIALGSLLKNSANITPVKPAPTPDQPAPLPTTTTTTTAVVPVKAPTKKEEKDLIKDKEPQTVLLGGITNEGIGDLQKKLPIVLKDVLDDFKKTIKNIKPPVIKVPPASESSGPLKIGGLIGTALDFFRKKKGTTAGNVARNRKAKQLRAERAARKAETGTTLKTAERGSPERQAKAKELRAERAARKAETGTTLKTTEKTVAKSGEKAAAKSAEKAVARAATKSAGKAAAKGAGKALLKSGLKKIPILGAVAGLGFGAQRALQGDWLGAAGEVASGAAGSVPGLGTAASVGIDAALAARDISKEVNQPEASSDTIKEAPAMPAAPGETIQPFKENNQDLKPVGTTTPPTPTANATDSNPNKDILNKIAENTSNTNSSIGALTQAVYKLAQSMGGKTGAPPVIVNGGQQKQDVGPSASQVAAANNDPIRNVRSQFAL